MTAGARCGPGRLAVWSVFLALSLRLLHGEAFGTLSVPLGSIDELAAWIDRTSPPVMAMAVVRLAALVAAWYLTGATVLAVVADRAGWRRVAAVVAALSPGVVRRLASSSAGVGLAAGALLAAAPLPPRLLAAPASAGAPGRPAEESPPSPAEAGTRLPAEDNAPAGEPATATATATMVRLPSDDAGPPTTEPPADAPTRLPADDAGPTPTATARRLPDGDVELPGTQLPPNDPGPSPATTRPDPAETTTPDVAPGHAEPPGTEPHGNTGPSRTTTRPDPAETTTPDPSGHGEPPARATMTRLDPASGPERAIPEARRDDPAVAGPDWAAEAGRSPADEPRAHEQGNHEPNGDEPADHEPNGDEPGDREPNGDEPGDREPNGDEPGDHEVWTVAPVDSFWSIAEETLTDLAGHRATRRDVGRYWLRLIEANRHRLADPANPDLLIPGQQLELPPPG